MKSNGVVLLATVVLAFVPVAAKAQSWEFGGAAGGGFYTSTSITNSFGSADAKISSGPVASAWLGFSQGSRWGGEVRYAVQMGDLQLNSGQASFGSATHTVHYDFLYHFRTNEDAVRPYVSFGAGVKLYQGTGTESVTQPLSRIALLTKTNDLRPVASFGVGVKARLGDHWQLRAGVSDYLTPFPTKVFAPNNGAKVGGWFNDIVPMVGLAYLF